MTIQVHPFEEQIARYLSCGNCNHTCCDGHDKDACPDWMQWVEEAKAARELFDTDFFDSAFVTRDILTRYQAGETLFEDDDSVTENESLSDRLTAVFWFIAGILFVAGMLISMVSFDITMGDQRCVKVEKELTLVCSTKP